MATKKTEKLEIGGKPGQSRLRTCDHCDQKAPASEMQAKLSIDYSSGTRAKSMQRIIKGHA